MRPVVRTEEDARRELDPRLSLVLWREADLALPFDRLSWDRFEIFSYLLLKREHPGEEIVYYGKTGDGGRDIVRYREDGSVELIQCKRYSGNVEVGDIRGELAKLFANLHSGEIPIKPDSVSRISFYAASDLTAGAKDLLRYPEKWREIAEKALTKHLRRSPSPDLLQFALSWWPEEGFFPEIAVDLTQRAEHHKALIEEFFRIRKVVDGSVPDIVAGVEVVIEKALDRRKVRITEDQSSDRTWESFFDEVEQGNASYSYLEDWPGITPDQRFEPPREYPEILEAVQAQPVTFLIGPPAAGKTFIALQMLWAAYQRGIQVLWIAPDTFVPTDGPIPSAHGLQDMKQRIKNLTYRLGLEPRKAPRNHHEFIAANLKSNRLIYIEDPFGKRDDEFAYSLHTYRFFDLDQFVEALSGSADYEGCNIIISSREGLFDRWLDERRSRGLPTPSALFRLSGDSFGYIQLKNLAIRLAQLRGFNAPEKISSEIAYRVEYPYEVESALRALPLDADPDRVAEEVEKYRNGLKDALRQTLVAESDQELLFLVILASRCIDPKTWYLRLHEVLGLPGETESSLITAIKPYRAFIIRKPLRVGSRSMNRYTPDADEVFYPSHPIVSEAISEYLKSCAPRIFPFLDRLASVLSASSEDSRLAERLSSIALYLLSLGVGSQPGPAQDSIATVLFERGGLSLDQVRPLTRMLVSLDETFKERMFTCFRFERRDAVTSKYGSWRIGDPDYHKESLLIEMASALPLVGAATSDAWRIFRLLLQNDQLMRRSREGSRGLEYPWSYLMKHLQEAPSDLLLDLEEIANNRPKTFVQMMFGALVTNWEVAPSAYKCAFFSKASTEDLWVQENVLDAIALYWELIPQELHDFFIRQARHEKAEIRAEAAIAAGPYPNENSVILDQVLMEAARDPDASVPLSVLQSLKHRDKGQRFARALVERADSELASEMLRYLLQPSHKELPLWQLDVVRDCVAKGGDRAESTLAFLRQEDGREMVTNSIRQWRASIADEPEPIRLGALWAYGSSNGKSPALESNEVIALINGLGQPYRSLALAYLSAHSKRLPQPIREYIENLETVQGSDGEAVRTGKKHQGSDKANNPWYFLPLIEQEKTEEIASTEHHS